jgi:hypothetical protein
LNKTLIFSQVFKKFVVTWSPAATLIKGERKGKERGNKGKGKGKVRGKTREERGHHPPIHNPHSQPKRKCKKGSQREDLIKRRPKEKIKEEKTEMHCLSENYSTMFKIV